MRTLNQLKDIRKELTRHDYRYYVLSDPVIPDQIYDFMVKDYESCLIEADLQHEDVGQATQSLEWEEGYPQWVRDEFKDVKPMR